MKNISLRSLLVYMIVLMALGSTSFADTILAVGQSKMVNGEQVSCAISEAQTGSCRQFGNSVHCGFDCQSFGNNVYCGRRPGETCEWFGNEVYCGTNCAKFGNEVHCVTGGKATPDDPR